MPKTKCMHFKITNPRYLYFGLILKKSEIIYFQYICVTAVDIFQLSKPEEYYFSFSILSIYKSTRYRKNCFESSFLSSNLQGIIKMQKSPWSTAPLKPGYFRGMFNHKNPHWKCKLISQETRLTSCLSFTLSYLNLLISNDFLVTKHIVTRKI